MSVRVVVGDPRCGAGILWIVTAGLPSIKHHDSLTIMLLMHWRGITVALQLAPDGGGTSSASALYVDEIRGNKAKIEKIIVIPDLLCRNFLTQHQSHTNIKILCVNLE